MLINADFERHDFVLFSRNEDNSERKYIPKHDSNNLKPPRLIITVTTERKGMQRVHLWAGEDVGYEIMWSPEQLRMFLVFHKVIENNKKLL